MALTAELNYLAVLVAAAASMVLGFLWYGPVFGNLWKQLAGFTDKDMKKMKMSPKTSMILAAFGALITSYVLAHFIDYLEAINFAGALQAAFWLWLGFVMPVQTGIVLWENKPWKLFVLNTAHNLVSLAVMAVILAVWV